MTSGRCLLCPLALVFALAIGGCAGGDDTPRRVLIPAGAPFRAAADTLAKHGIVRFPRLFAWYAALTGRDRAIRFGTYQFSSNQSWSELLDALAAGRGLVRTITVPEGWNLGKIVPQLARVLEVAPESVTAAVTDTALRRRLNVPTSTIEGYLFPDTYAFAPNATAREAVRIMVERFEDVWNPVWDSLGRNMAMTRHDLVTLASIIETEARVPEERPVISAVYHNRLRIGMRLQADPTVQYALGRHVERVLYKDLEVDSRYNTYRYAGLPPGPIASPGAPSLAAAATPARVPFLYFVAHPDGHHEFRRTFREHAAAIRAAKRAREAAAGAKQ
ncbi:MAG: endolytic transglycosylase MltG [Gemmatimonadaceae bacterium]